jgi:hypothetical protein
MTNKEVITMTDMRIHECKDMINVLKIQAKSISTRKNTTVIKDVKLDSFLYIMDEIIKILDTKITEIEITEHHTFAKPNDVSDLDFPGVSSEDK